MPYALASGLLEPGGREATGVTRYLLLHGSRLLGLVRAGAYALYGDARVPTSGTDQVYGLNMARFLADNDRPDQLVLSLYGHLAAGMAPGTFVSGEAASVAPLPGETLRAMFLPPNGTSNAAYLETLRLTLVHETTDRAGRPHGLQLAYATPRAWLEPGKRIAVRDMPTSFGPISYSIESRTGAIRASIDVPDPRLAADASPATPGACRLAAHNRLARRATLRKTRTEGRDDHPPDPRRTSRGRRRHRPRAMTGRLRGPASPTLRDGPPRSLVRGFPGNIPPTGDGSFGKMPTSLSADAHEARSGTTRLETA